MAGNDTADFSSQLIHLVPDPKDYLCENSYRKWASRYVLAEFSKSLPKVSMEYLRKSVARDPKGFLFEFLVIGMFQCTEAKYTCKWEHDLISIAGGTISPGTQCHCYWERGFGQHSL